jgi:molybdate transport system regulatory protein
MTSSKPRLFLSVVLDTGRLVGPGRADLLEGVDRLGSISAAAREMDMSYRQAWLLLADVARHLGEAVVETRQGGRAGGGAMLTPAGRTLLNAYRRLQRRAATAVDRELEQIGRLLESAERRRQRRARRTRTS